MERIRTLIADPSPTFRSLVRVCVAAAADIEVVGEADNACAARDRIRELQPDVLAMDLALPGMDAVQFLRRMMQLHPMPAVVMSNPAEVGPETVVAALDAGAIDHVQKRELRDAMARKVFSREVTCRIHAAARANVRHRVSARALQVVRWPVGGAVDAIRRLQPADARIRRVIAIGASTGGNDAVRDVLANGYSADAAAVVTQHISERFVGRFAERLQAQTPWRVVLATPGQPLQPGVAYVAPGGSHLQVVRAGTGLACALSSSHAPLVSGHKPSVDAMFESLARSAPRSTVAILLTGMGRDGARGMQELHAAGAFTVAQDQATSVVWGMPGAAVALGAVHEVLPLPAIGYLLGEVAAR